MNIKLTDNQITLILTWWTLSRGLPAESQATADELAAVLMAYRQHHPVIPHPGDTK